MRILVYGAGTIGSLYAVLLANAGLDVSVFARGNRLAFLRSNGLLYLENSGIKQANVKVIEHLGAEDIYDFIILAVRTEQVSEALAQLKENKSWTIVTMVNTIENYSNWENICGEGRILPAFPGAGGGITDGVLEAELCPRFVQPTTFGEIHGEKSERLNKLRALFRKCGVPYKIVPDMQSWQLSHVAFVIPLADAYYMSDHPETVFTEHTIMRRTAESIKANFRCLYKAGRLTPQKLRLLRLCPTAIFSLCLKAVYRSSFGHRFMYRHSLNAPEEIRLLHEQFYRYLDDNNKASQVE